MIPPSEIARLAHRLGLGDKTIEKDYVLTWVLLGRTEPRDLYDAHYLLANDMADAEAVSFRLAEKMAPRGLDPTALGDVLARKQSTFSRLWEPRLCGQMPDLPRLDTVIRETDRWLRQSGLV